MADERQVIEQALSAFQSTKNIKASLKMLEALPRTIPVDECEDKLFTLEAENLEGRLQRYTDAVVAGAVGSVDKAKEYLKDLDEPRRSSTQAAQKALVELLNGVELNVEDLQREEEAATGLEGKRAVLEKSKRLRATTKGSKILDRLQAEVTALEEQSLIVEARVLHQQDDLEGALKCLESCKLTEAVLLRSTIELQKKNRGEQELFRKAQEFFKDGRIEDAFNLMLQIPTRSDEMGSFVNEVRNHLLSEMSDDKMFAPAQKKAGVFTLWAEEKAATSKLCFVIGESEPVDLTGPFVGVSVPPGPTAGSFPRIKLGHLWCTQETRKYEKPMVVWIGKASGNNHVHVVVAEAKDGGSLPALLVPVTTANFPKEAVFGSISKARFETLANTAMMISVKEERRRTGGSSPGTPGTPGSGQTDFYGVSFSAGRSDLPALHFQFLKMAEGRIASQAEEIEGLKKDKMQLQAQLARAEDDVDYWKAKTDEKPRGKRELDYEDGEQDEEDIAPPGKAAKRTVRGKAKSTKKS